MITLSRDDAQRSVDAVEEALKAGCTPPGMFSPKGTLSAVKMAAKRLGVQEITLRSRIKEGGPCETHYGIGVDWSLYKAPEPAAPADAPASKPELTVIERQNQRLQDENRELRRRLADALRQANADDLIREILGGIVAGPAKPPEWLLTPKVASGSQEVPITIWSDWHASETVSAGATNGVNEFDHAILERRVRRLVERTIDLCANHGPANYPGIVINLLGDMISGSIHAELATSDEEEVIPSSLRVRDLLVWAIGTMADHFGQVYIPCAAGNHSRATTRPEYKRYVFKSFDWLIYQLLARHFENDTRITFDIRESNEVRYKVYGQRYLAMHGDMLGTAGGDGIIGAIGPIMRGEVKVGKQSAAMGLDYDVLVIGHWHQSLWLNRIICNNALVGFNEYALLKLRAPPSIPSQSLWFVHPKWGRTSHREIFLENPVMSSDTAWVSFQPLEHDRAAA